MYLKQLKTTYFDPEKKYNFLFPIGATEQHGPFLPFGTDTYITDKLVADLEKKFPDFIILPTLEYSRSDEHRGFYGTTWLKNETLLSIIYDVCNSISKYASRLILISFHANQEIFDKFIEFYKKDFADLKIVNLEVADQAVIDQIEKIINGPIDDHAGNTEISNMLAIDEKLVEKPSSNYPKKIIDNPFEFNDLKKKTSDGVVDNHPNWIIDKKLGEKILKLFSQKMINDLVRTIIL